MKKRILVLLTVAPLALAATLVFASIALAQDVPNCDDFDTS
jgi:hypothetical protein